MTNYTEADYQEDMAREGKLEVIQQRDFEINGTTYTASGWNASQLNASEKRIRKAVAKGAKTLGRTESLRWAEDLD